MSEATKQVVIFEDDCEQLLEALGTAYRFAASYDIFNQYKNLAHSLQPSPLTKQLDRNYQRLKNILEDHYEQDDDTVPNE